MAKLADGTWTMDEETAVRGKKLGLELLFSVRETVPKTSQNEAIAACLAFLLGKHYATIHELGSAREAEGWLSMVFEAASRCATRDGAPIGFAYLRQEGL